ncbi:Uncharacterised protein at_DN1466 [Pycnogonum litorale]
MDQYKIPSIQEMTAKLAGSNYFVTLDAISSFWQMKLDDNSQELTTFSTPFGNLCFNRLPFGLNLSSQAYQKVLSNWFEGQPGMEIYTDDLLIHAPDKQTLLKRLKTVFDICRQKNLKLNKNKCVFNLNEVKYLGAIINSTGQKIDPDRVSSILDMKSPETKEELQRFLGMLTYVSNFIPNLANETATLRKLLTKDASFMWSANREQEFLQLKQLLTQTPVLRFFDPNKEVKVSCDSSKHGLGACLTHNGQPVCFASCTLTTSEANYSQIEKELLSVVFAVERFHQYVYGRKFIVENDHKPLKFLFKKSLSSCPPRIERLMIRLQKYNFTFEWIPGKALLIPDTLSRSPQLHTEADAELHDELQCQVHMIQTSLPFSETKLKQFNSAIESDEEMTQLKQMILNGWPEQISEVPNSMTKYWNFREELAVEDDIILKGSKVIIPKSWQSELLSRIHGHLGVEKCINRAGRCMFWTGMTTDINDLVLNCGICNKFKPRQSKEPLLSHDRPTTPWMKVGCDVFHFENNDYLLIVDYHSDYPEVSKLNSLTANDIIRKMKSVFARNGIPEMLISDNGPNFINSKFKEFTDNWGITHETSSPHYPKV